MIATLIGLHFLVAITAPLLSRGLGTRAFWVVSIVPALAFLWLVQLGPVVLGGGAHSFGFEWIVGLGVSLDFRIGLVQWILGLIVTGVGALVLFYCAWYFPDPQRKVVGLLTAFAGAMLGLVSADNLIVVYVFWELTTVFSYLLIAHDPSRRANRAAAVTALIVTTTGGLAMLAGLLVLGGATGTFSLQGILAAQPSGTAVNIAAFLVLVGALSKSALVPFHFWLPGAMAAPTPISAYLHAATMVKAGVYLVAVFAPLLASTPSWRPLVWTLGALTLILGGWRALRQEDLKLLLAYGTVSQLGFLILLLGTGTRAGALAGLAMTVAHALFKATLFLVVGVIDHATGTRQINELSGLGRQMPILATIGALGAASMAGLPPMLGFIAKEAGLEAVSNLGFLGDGTRLAPVPAWLLIAAVVTGSMLTVAYSARFWWGAFVTKPDLNPTRVLHPPAVGFSLAPVLLGSAGLAGGFLGVPLTAVFSGYADQFQIGTPSHGLKLVPQIGLPLWFSLLAILFGLAMFWQRDRIASLQRTFPSMPGAVEVYRATMSGLDRIAVEVTSRTQGGSLARYVNTILVVLSLGLFWTLAQVRHWPGIRWADNWAQPVVGLITVFAAILVVTSRGRLRAIVLLGVTGYGTALLFLLHGAPDLALTQVLAETGALLAFLLVLRKLPKFFTNRPLASNRWWRMLIAVGTGTAMTLVAVLMYGSRIAEPISTAYPRAAKEIGYGYNIVNVILVDTRAWDTIGEISVLAVAATGVASLIYLRGRQVTLHRLDAEHRSTSWLPATLTLPVAHRSLIFEVVTRYLFPIAILVSIYLLLAGHNFPGGGFAGGLVAGIAVLIRYLAGGGRELDAAMPVPAGALIGGGLVTAVLTAVTPLFFGAPVFTSAEIHLRIPGLESLVTPWGTWTLFGDIHLVSSTVFDIGVYLVVVGMMLDLGRSLGSGIDTQAQDELTPAPVPESDRALPGREWV